MARNRVARGILRDPLWWIMLVVIIVVGIRSLNTGILLAYDAEQLHWYVAEAKFPLLPGAVAGSGFLPFAAAVAFTVVVLGCRHALGKSARAAFLLVASVLAGIGGAVALTSLSCGNDYAGALMKCTTQNPSYCAAAFGVYLSSSVVAMVAVFERRWYRVTLLVMLAVIGCTAALVAFAPPPMMVVMAGALVIVFIYAFIYSMRKVRNSGEFKLLVMFAFSFVLGLMLAYVTVPSSIQAEKIAYFEDFKFLSEDFLRSRSTLSAIAAKAWQTHLWLGSGLATFALDLRFNAVEADWLIILPGQLAPLNGWWLLLSERGIVGVAMLALPFGVLLYTYLRRLCTRVAFSHWPDPCVWLGLVELLAVVALTFFDCSLLRADALIALGAMMATSASSFFREKE